MNQIFYIIVYFLDYYWYFQLKLNKILSFFTIQKAQPLPWINYLHLKFNINVNIWKVKLFWKNQNQKIKNLQAKSATGKW